LFLRRVQGIFILITAITPKALANCSPGLERSDNPGELATTIDSTLKGFAARGTLSGFKVFSF
jgi:hypothetical protein